MENHAERTFAWAAAILDGLVHAGVRDAVLSPGAQMAPFSLARHTNDRLKSYMLVDERTAGFFAVGLAKRSRRPAALICTSGSAVGQWYPAVMEAAAGLVPLVLLTTDKSPEDQGRSAAQAIDQSKVFGSHVRAFHGLHLPDDTIGTLPSLTARLVEQSMWPLPGPVHINVPLREPLVPKTRRKVTLPMPPVVNPPRLLPDEIEMAALARTLSGRPGVIVCGPIHHGDRFSTALGRLATALGCPVIADSASGLRFGPHHKQTIMTHADAFLRRTSFVKQVVPEWVLCFGGPSTSKSILGWLDACGACDHVVIDPFGRWPDPLGRATRIVRADPDLVCEQLTELVTAAPHGWLESFQAEERRAERILHEGDEDLWEAPVIRRLLGAAPEGGIVLTGNSTPVRDFDSFSGTSEKHVRLVANRGTNGIDGSIALLAGLAAGSPHKTIGMIGDLSFAHDMGSLQAVRGQDVLLVVINNGGGAIFEYQAVAGIPEFNDFLSEPTIHIGHAAAACGWRHTRATTLHDLDRAIVRAMAAPAQDVVEVVIDRRRSVRRHKDFWSAVAAK